MNKIILHHLVSKPGTKHLKAMCLYPKHLKHLMELDLKEE